MFKFRSTVILSLAIFSLFVPSAQAATFPDVPAYHIHFEAVEQLAATGVIGGNPDGSFDPDRKVNRAEMLKMLYKASGRIPDSSANKCFKDVPEGAWFEPYVCDAAASRFVSGYANGLFKPEQSVNKVEALKMIVQVFGFELVELSDEDKDVINFADVSPSSWYGRYLFVAYDSRILPIPGQDNSYFRPDAPLSRSEAAAYIYNSLKAQLRMNRNSASSVSSEPSAVTPVLSASSAASSASSEDTYEDTRQVSFPFSTTGKFNKTRSFAYEFTLDKDEVIDTHVKLQAGQPGSVRCTLYLLQDDGLSHEYYLGTEEGANCYLLTALQPGRYQLQIAPTKPDVTYEVTTKVGKGDGNDGFSQAKRISQAAKTYFLEPNNYQNWYTFSVKNETSMMVELTNALELRCVIYAMEDVDLYGFNSPKCNQVYKYTEGTYFVSIGRSRSSRVNKKTYSIHLK